MRGACRDYKADARQLWRRILFNHLVTNVDDHLRNLGFLYAERNFWSLSPAFDLNPFPDKKRVSKTPLSPDTGPVTSVEQIMGQATRFELQPDAARSVAREVVAALLQWRHVAVSHEVGLAAAALHDFAAAFEHGDLKVAQAL